MANHFSPEKSCGKVKILAQPTARREDQVFNVKINVSVHGVVELVEIPNNKS
jgi:hypothetical protein